jgi:signal transduction histidine kinase/ligand-binding sensor domain-containing protein
MKNRSKLTALLLMLFASAYSQQSFFFKNYTTDQGMSDNHVRCIVKDAEGFIWVGTESGLNRFDGTRFVNFRSWSSDSTTITSNSIYDLLVDSKKRLWVGAIGVSMYKPLKGNFSRIKAINHKGESDYTTEIFSIYEDRDGRILICTPYIGVQFYDERYNRFEKFITSAKNSRGENVVLPYSITSIVQDEDGIYWLLNYTNVYKYDRAKGTIDEISNRLTETPNSSFQGLRIRQHKNDRNQLLITTWGDGLVIYNKEQKSFRSALFESNKPKNLTNIIMDVFQRDSTSLWVGTNVGIKKYNLISASFDETITDQFNKESLVNQAMINVIYQDVDSVIWIGSPLGLAAIHPGKQLFAGRKLADFNRSFFIQNPTDSLIYATEYYLNRSLKIIDPRISDSKTYPLPGADAILAEPFHVSLARDNTVWIGTTKGMYWFKKKWNAVRKYDLSYINGVAEDPPRIVAMLTDRNGDFWVVCRNYILFKKSGCENFERIDSVKTSAGVFLMNNVEFVTETSSGEVVFYSAGNDLLYLNSNREFKKRVRLANPDGGKILQVSDMEPGINNSLWLTTKTNGLIQISEKGNLKIYRNDFLGNQLSDLVSLETDDKFNPWFVAGGKFYTLDTNTDQLIFYSAEDGLSSVTRYTNLEKFPDGSIAYNTTHGLFSFSPGKLVHRSESPEIVLYSIYVNGKVLESRLAPERIHSIALKHNQNNIVFDFVAKEFLSPKSVLFSYMLEGASNEWSTPSPVGLLSFNQLSPGTYTLKVKAGTPFIEEDAIVRQVQIVIDPAWYQTLWFKVLFSLIVLIILVFAIRFLVTVRFKEQIVAMNHYREIEQIRAGISRDIHDEIGAGLTKIKLMTRKLFRTETGLINQDDAKKISNTADELIRNLGEIVWTINPENDSLKNIVAYIRMYLSRLAEEQSDCEIEFELPSADSIPDKAVNPKVKRNVLLILKESLTNSIKHAHCTKVKIVIRLSENYIHMSAHDNGRGFEMEGHISSGNGLKNMKKRAEEIGGDLEIESSDSGTIINLKAPVV